MRLMILHLPELTSVDFQKQTTIGRPTRRVSKAQTSARFGNTDRRQFKSHDLAHRSHRPTRAGEKRQAESAVLRQSRNS